MPDIVLTAAQAKELLPLARQQLLRMQQQQTLSERMGIADDWSADAWEAIVQALQRAQDEEVVQER